MKQIHKVNEVNMNKEKVEKYGTNVLFDNKYKEIQEQTIIEEKKEFTDGYIKVSVYKMNIFSKIWGKLKNLFKIK